MVMAEEKLPDLVPQIRRLDNRSVGGSGTPGSTTKPTKEVLGIVSETLNPLDNPNDVPVQMDHKQFQQLTAHNPFMG